MEILKQLHINIPLIDVIPQMPNYSKLMKDILTKRKIEDVLVRVDKFVFHVDFIIMDFNDDEETPILLGIPFLANGITLIDVGRGQLTMRVNGQDVVFNVFNALKYSEEEVVDCSMISCWENISHKNLLKSNNILEKESRNLNKKDEEKEVIINGS